MSKMKIGTCAIALGVVLKTSSVETELMMSGKVGEKVALHIGERFKLGHLISELPHTKILMPI